MAGEVFAWPDGNVWLYTGTATASALVAYATETTVREFHGAENWANLNGEYRNTVTGRVVQVTIGALYCADVLPLQVMASAETAVHLHIAHNNGLASAGRRLYSGFIDSLEEAGRENDLFRARLTYHANVWSAY